MRSILITSVLLHTAAIATVALMVSGPAERPAPPELRLLPRQPSVSGESEPEPIEPVFVDPAPPLPMPEEDRPLEELPPIPDDAPGPEREPTRLPETVDWSRAHPHRVLQALVTEDPEEVPEETPPEPTTPSPPAAEDSPLVPATPLADSNTAPNYPKRAKRLGLQGSVWLDVIIAPDGSVLDVQLAEPLCPHVLLNRAAIAAVRTWRYRPAMQNGKAMRAHRREQIIFRLEDY